MGDVARLLVVIAWVAVLGVLMQWSDSNAAAFAGIGASLLAGILIGRWWALIVVAIPAVWIVGSWLVAPPDPNSEDWSGVILLVLLTVAGGPLGIGVALRRTAEWLNRRAERQSSNSA
jgi:hypothetical protein